MLRSGILHLGDVSMKQPVTTSGFLQRRTVATVLLIAAITASLLGSGCIDSTNNNHETEVASASPLELQVSGTTGKYSEIHRFCGSQIRIQRLEYHRINFCYFSLRWALKPAAYVYALWLQAFHIHHRVKVPDDPCNREIQIALIKGHIALKTVGCVCCKLV